jgi:hypothetical protein
MIGRYPIVTFDTAAHNRLVDDGPVSEAILAGIKSGLYFRFAGLSLEELRACPNPVRRDALFKYCGRLQQGQTDCIYPHNELLKRLILSHSNGPENFDWKAVNVRAWEYERGVRDRDFLDNEALTADQRQHHIVGQKEYQQLFSRLRLKLGEIFAAQRVASPPTFRQAIAQSKRSEPNLILAIGKELYDRPAGTDASGTTINEFVDTCPPFRALIYSILMSWYDISLRDRHTGEKFRAGRNDLFMSVYLPYCDKFITAEKNREQEKCLRELAAAANLEAEIVDYDDFCASFLVTV